MAYNALLNLHARSRQASAAEAVYQGMLQNGPKPDSISVNTLIAAHAEVPLTSKTLGVMCALHVNGPAMALLSDRAHTYKW